MKTTSIDVTVLTEHGLNTSRSPWPPEGIIWILAYLGRTKERKQKEEESKRWGSWSSGEIPHPEESVVTEREASEAIGGWRSWSTTVWIEWKPHRQSESRPYITCPGMHIHRRARQLGPGACRLESKPRARTALDGGEMTWRKGGNLHQGMPFKGNRAAPEAGCYCWVTCRGWGHLCSLFLPTYQPWPLSNREGPQRGQRFKHQLPEAGKDS